MKDIMKLYAKYNTTANANLCEILNRLDEKSLNKNVGIYYKNILETFKHIMFVDIAIFIGNFAKYANSKIDGVDSVGHILESNEYKNNDIKYLIAKQAVVDKIIEDIINNTEDFSINAEVAFITKTMSKPLYHLMLTILNHATHHRGEISASLDIIGVENDFASLLSV